MGDSAGQRSQTLELLACEGFELSAPGLRDIPIYLQHAVDPIRPFDQLNAGGNYDFASVPSLLTQFAFPRASYSHLFKNLRPRLWKLGRQQRIRQFSDRFGF